MPSESFTVFIYENEIQYAKWLVLQREDIETGGDLFGLWRTENTAVVQLLLGPGKSCSRSCTSFHQDVKYLDEVGQNLTKLEGLCNIGEWHSHHKIGLAKPSDGDQRTVWGNINTVAGGRFIVFIANITGSTSQPVVNVRCFLFDCATKEMSEGALKYLPESSPLRLSLNEAYLAPGIEPETDWETFDVASRETSYQLSKPIDKKLLTTQREQSNKTKKGKKEMRRSDEDEYIDDGWSSESRKATKSKLFKPHNYGTLRDEQNKQSGRRVITKQPAEKQHLLRDIGSPVPDEKEESDCACCKRRSFLC